MSKIHIDTYYDITCQECGRSRSTDFQRGMEMSKARLSKLAYSEGWKCKANRTLCPECAEIADDPSWVNVNLGGIPLISDEIGLENKTEKKFWVIAHDGYTCYGHIYKNPYSSTGYAVYCGNDVYFNNVTHWAPDGRPKKSQPEF